MNYNYFLLFLCLTPLLFHDSFAQETYRGETYTDIDYGNKTHTWIGGLSPYIETGELDNQGRKIFTHYILSEDVNSVTVQNGEASFVFDKITCSAQIYSGGAITGNSIVSSDSYVPKFSTDGSGIWNIVNSVNDASCVTSIEETPTSIKITGTKQSSAGIFKVSYLKEDGSPLKTILEATNLTALTDKRFGVTQTQSIPQLITFGGQQRDLANHIGETFDRTWLENNKANLLEYTSGLKFDVIDAWDNLESIKVNSVSNGVASVSFNYLRNTPILLPNETLIVDPTYSQTYTYLAGVEDQNNSDTCNTGSTKYTTVYYLGYVFNSASASDCVREAISWNTSSISDTAIITDSDFIVDVKAVTNVRNCDIRYYGTSNPSSDSAATLFTNVGSGATYVDNNTFCTVAGNNVSVDLGSSADTQITSDLSIDRFTLGFTFDSETVDASIHSSEFEFAASPTPLPTLNLTYVIPCTAPTMTTKNTISTTRIDLAWSQPSPNCGVSAYKVFESKNSATYTLKETLGNVTSTSYTTLDTGTMYSYKVSATNGVTGYGANSTIGTNSTLPIAPTSLVATPASKTKINIDYSDGSQPNVLWFKSRYALFPSGTWVNFDTNSTVSTPRYENFTGLGEGIKYNFAISSGTLGGFGAWSSNVTATTYTTTSGTLTYVYSNVGDAFLFNGTLASIIASPSPQTATKIQIIDNGTITNSKTISNTLTDSSSSPITFIPYQVTDNNVHNIKLRLTATNQTGTVTIDSTGQNVTRQYDPDYFTALDPTQGLVNYTFSGANSINVNRDTNSTLFNIECLYLITAQAFFDDTESGVWDNKTNVLFYVGDIGDYTYVQCFNDGELFSTGLPQNYSNALLPGLIIFDQLGGFFGAPSIILVIIAILSLGTGRNYPIIMLIAASVTGILLALGLLVLDAGLVVAITVMTGIGLFGIRKFY